MRIKYPHDFSIDRCQFLSDSAATPSGHARFVAAASQGFAYPVQSVQAAFEVF